MTRFAPAHGMRRWRRLSLRLRVIIVTMTLGLGFAGLLGSVLFAQVAQGLVDEAVDEAVVDAGQQTSAAQTQFGAIELRDTSSLNNAATEVLQTIAPSSQGARHALLTRGISNDRSTVVNALSSGGLTGWAAPGALISAIDAEPTIQHVMVTEVVLDEEDRAVPSVVIGARVDVPRAGPYDLVLVYPMYREQATLDLVRQWFLIGGAGLILLIGGMAWLATRLVTDPVGRAVRVTQRLARGDLDQRLTVGGSNDELDRLATSFNSMADSLQQQIRQLERLSMLQQRFVSDVSHELRTPLTTIRMASEVLHASRDDFAEPVARSTELLQSELDRFEDLLTELLEISRYDSGAAVLDVEPVDLLALTEQVAAGFEVLSTRTGSSIRIQSADARVMAVVDSRRVARILRNLIGNAIEHGEGHPIDVRILRSAPETADVGKVAIRVRDYGVGLSENEAKQVFDRFWRADVARTRTTGGTGLGLSISREDARLHGGWLKVSGRPRQGACFELTLPIEEGVTIPEPPEPHLTRPSRVPERRRDPLAGGGAERLTDDTDLPTADDSGSGARSLVPEQHAPEQREVNR